MRGLNFQVQQVIDQASPQRLDIACFVGCVDMRPDAPRDDIDDWLYRQSWLDARDGAKATYHRESARVLLDVPVPIDSWERFDRLFAWEQRRYSEDIAGAGYLAAAVREFFIQGGRLCYVIRVADNLDYNADAAAKTALLTLLMPGYPTALSSQPNDRSSWHGVGHLFGLPDVSMLCLPDLPELFASPHPDQDVSPPAIDTAAEQFVICQPAEQDTAADAALRQLAAPVCDDAQFTAWGRAVNLVTRFVARYMREVQLIAAVPLPAASSLAACNPLGFMHEQGWFSGSLESNADSLASAFVQLAYPWVQCASSAQLAQGFTPPDGLLTGLLARNALQRGTYRSITDQPLKQVVGLTTELSREQQFAPYARAAIDASPDAALIDRVSLIGFDAAGITVLSDVTTSSLSAHRPAAINRIIAMLVRIARQAGEEYVFDNNGPALWAEVSQRLGNVLRRLFDLGALRGKEPSDAYFVRCDRSTMTQQDIDAGRIIALVQFNPAAPIESIEVLLQMQPNGGMERSTTGTTRAVA